MLAVGMIAAAIFSKVHSTSLLQCSPLAIKARATPASAMAHMPRPYCNWRCVSARLWALGRATSIFWRNGSWATASSDPLDVGTARSELESSVAERMVKTR